MSGIAGFCCYTDDLTDNAAENTGLLAGMCHTLRRRGGYHEQWLDSHCGLSATVSAKPGGASMPFILEANGGISAIVWDGEVYNRAELWAEQGQPNRGSDGDAMLVLSGFVKHGVTYFKRLNGVLACAIWHNSALYLVRDHAGIKPLFFTEMGGYCIFASEIKGLFAYPGVKAQIDRQGVSALLALGPAREEYSGVFKNIYTIPPGCIMVIQDTKKQVLRYWDMDYHPHTDNEAAAIAKVRTLLLDAVTRQVETRDEVCSFLSGGVDSSIVTAVAADLFQKEGKTLKTYSFDFKDSVSHFQSNAFQPDRDRPWVEQMAAFCRTEHHYIECGPDELARLLYDAVNARDLPGMADIDASLLYFCSRMPKGTVALTGECADELFGGYPWFHRPMSMSDHGFPWSADMDARKTLFSDELLRVLNLEETAERCYRETLKAVPRIPDVEGDAVEKHLRAVSYMTVKWFMTTLTDRMDRMGAYAGINARVPFADIRLMEYVWNIPWTLKNKNNVVKYVLREAARGLLPDEVLFRKKSPFPKTYDPRYGAMLAQRLRDEVLDNPNAPVHALIDRRKVKAFMDAPENVSRPWFGQLMAGPQRLAYLLQVNHWLKQYKVDILI